jgi:hypothetical protein
VKEDRKKRLEKQGIISSSGTETGQSQSVSTHSASSDHAVAVFLSLPLFTMKQEDL